MTVFDATKLISGLKDEIERFPVMFVSVISGPFEFFSEIARLKSDANNRLIKVAVVFGAICIVIGTAVGGYFELEKVPEMFSAASLITVLLLWFGLGLVAHPFIRLFGGRGHVYQTIAVFLFVISALHIVWLPLFAIVAKNFAETRVVLTYDYAISFAALERNSPMSSYGMDVPVAQFTETYFPSREPEKEGTVLPPAEAASDAPLWRDEPNRISIEESTFPAPAREEVVEIGEPYKAALLALFVGYVSSHFFYLAKGVSAVHGRSWQYWLFLAYALPLGGAIAVLIALIAYGGFMSS
jgi:hypothetical protein